MKFAKYYHVTGLLNKMIDEDVLKQYQKDYAQELYICMDTHDFWICRILKDINEEAESQEGTWLIERNKINQYEFLGFIEKKYNRDYKIENRQDRDNTLNKMSSSFVIKNLILLDDYNGLENWDNEEFDSLNKCIEVLDAGFGIIEL